MASRSPRTSSFVPDLDEALALVRSVRPPTPLEEAPELSRGGAVMLKREDHGPNGSFKWRGALAALSSYRHEGAEAVVTASTGNHGAATAWAARELGLTAYVVVPEAASGVKCELIEDNGAVLERVGAELEEAAAHALRLAERLGAPYFEDGASAAQLAGAATVGAELAEQGVRSVISPIGVGALAGGVGIGMSRFGPPPRLTGVQARGYHRLGSELFGLDWAPPRTPTFADGLADNRLLHPALDACRDHVERVIVASDDQLRRAVRELHAATGILAEGAGAAALAGLRELERQGAEPDPVTLMVSGKNIDPTVAERILG